MALRWIEGFESFGTTNGSAPVGLKQKYDMGTDDSTFLVEAGRVTGHSMRFGTTPGIAGKTVPAASTLIAGFGFLQDSFNSAQVIFQFRDGAHGGSQGTLEIQTSGLWKYYRGGNIGLTGALLGTSSGNAIVASTWAYVEIKVKFHASAGTVDIWVNGNSVLSLTGQNTDGTGSATANGAFWEGSLNGTDHTTFDDIYVLDDTGSLNNARLGPNVVKMIIPNSDAGTNQFTTDSGSTHYNRLTDNPEDGDTTYLQDSTTGDRELFGMTTLSIGSVLGIQLNAVCKVTDNTAFSIKNSSHSGSTDTDQSAVAISDPSNYQTVSNVMETDPNTSAAWLATGVNAATFGFKTG